jgi:hypothetical protein
VRLDAAARTPVAFDPTAAALLGETAL